MRKTEYFPVLLTERQMEAVRLLADERQSSRGAVIRWAVETAVVGKRAALDGPPGEKNESSVGLGNRGAALTTESR